MPNRYVTIDENKFIEQGQHVINEICKKFDDPRTKTMFSRAAEVFLTDFKEYLIKESEVKR